MNVFITGATGYVGGAVAEAVTRAGHRVTALAHTAESAAAARLRGWRVAVGDLRDTALLARLAGEADAVIHAANTGGADAALVDADATRSLLGGLKGTGRPFVYTSGVWVLGRGSSDESTPARPAEVVAWRATLEQQVLAAAPDVTSVVLRPAIVFGRGGGIPGMMARGELPVVGTGGQRWPLVHVDDLADLYVRALRAAPGSILHGVATTVTMGELAGLVCVGTGAPPSALTLDEARARFGVLADALALDQDVSAMRTRAALGWEPQAHLPVAHLVSIDG